MYISSAHSSRTKSERIRNEADTLIANCSSKTQRSQQEASNRLGTRIEDCNSWRADLQTELDNNIRWAEKPVFSVEVKPLLQISVINFVGFQH